MIRDTGSQRRKPVSHPVSRIFPIEESIRAKDGMVRDFTKQERR